MTLRTLAALICAGCCVGLGACSTPFLHGAASSAATLKDDGLSGEWLAGGTTTTRAVIGTASSAGYPVTVTVLQDGMVKSTLTLDATLTEIGKDRYWDLFLSRSERDKLVVSYGFLAVPVHQIMKISRSGDELRVWSFKGAWLEDAARNGQFSHETIAVGGGEISMITAQTETVRELIARHADDPGAFDSPIVFQRVNNSTK